MITKLALLPRILPGLFRRLPAATSVGYLMPHTRYVFAGISGSVALHAAVLFAFNPPMAPIKPSEPPVVTICELTDLFRPPEELPKEEPKPEENEAKEPSPAEARNAEYSRFSEPISNPSTEGIRIEVPKPDIGKPPSMSSNLPGIPTGPHTGGGGGGATVFSIGDLDKIPVATNRAAPRYPFEMKRTGATGTVVLRFVVDSRGDVSEVEVVSATTSEFGTAATEAMLKWKFRAGMKNGRRVNTRMEMPMNFSLEHS